MRFLIVDDQKVITKPLQELIEEEGHHCVVASGGEKGLKLIKEQNWDTVLLDLAMPGFSGFKVIEKLESEDLIKKNKIILFTASSVTDGEVSKLLSKGIHSYIRKPVDVEQILKALGIE